MIKLFGWEARVADQIDERRQAELAYLRKTKFLQLANNLIKYLSSAFLLSPTCPNYFMSQQFQHSTRDNGNHLRDLRMVYDISVKSYG